MPQLNKTFITTLEMHRVRDEKKEVSAVACFKLYSIQLYIILNGEAKDISIYNPFNNDRKNPLPD